MKSLKYLKKTAGEYLYKLGLGKVLKKKQQRKRIIDLTKSKVKLIYGQRWKTGKTIKETGKDCAT